MRELNLLVLDDDPSILRLTVKLLKKELGSGVAVTALDDPLLAQQWLRENCCDILLTDIEMPEIDGLEMLKFAKARNAWTQVIFLTGASTWDRIAEAIEFGASDYLLKPIDRGELITIVGQAVNRFNRWQSAVLDTLEAGIKQL
jgi:DNA-binding NtrC family response regulator